MPESAEKFASCYISDISLTKEFADDQYETESAKLADAGYRLWNKGVLLESTKTEVTALHAMPTPTLKDEYIFVKKYWGSGWVNFTFLLRLLTFKNPFKECHAYFNTRNVNRINMFDSPITHSDYDSFKSSLVESQPLVAVIIPTLNRYDYLKDALHDLEKQSYSNFEVIIVDQSDEFQKDFYNHFRLKLKVIPQNEKLLWTARNRAIEATTADFLLFFDDDSRVDPDWILQHLKCIDLFKIDISAGVSLAQTGQKIPKNYSYFRWSDQFDSGNAMIKRTIMRQIGMFDEQFNKQRMGDAEFGLRAYLNGFRSISNHKAFRIHLKVSSGGLREMTGWDAFRPKKWLAPKPVPSLIYLYKKYFPPQLYRNAFFIGIMLSNVPYKYKGSSKMLLLSIFLTVLKAPVLVIQFYKSNRIANKMLNVKEVPLYESNSGF
jgi:glycosyltransferase involved in cell wall biosynthesis